MLTHRRRSGERGQTLALAIAFLAFFGVLAATVLTFASTVQSQRTATEKTAAINSVTEGSAQFAQADTGVQGCGTVTGGTMKFPSGDTLKFTAGAGTCTSSVSTAPGQDCGLCVLNFNNISTPIDVNKGSWTVPSEIDVNGSINVNKLTSGLRIGLFGSGATCGTTCTPGAVALASKVLDPLGGALPIPDIGAGLGDQSGNKVLCPNTYHNLTVGNSDILFLSAAGQNGCPSASGPSVYVITGQLSNNGGGSIASGGVTLYLSPTASINFNGNPSSQISLNCGATPVLATCAATANPPTTGPYAGVTLFVDPANTSHLTFQGNGNFTLAGTTEASHAILDMGGNGGTQSFQSGRLIISEIRGNGNGGAGLGFSGTVPSATGCNYWTDGLTGTESGGANQVGTVRFETGCNSGSPTSVIGFAYGAGP